MSKKERCVVCNKTIKSMVFRGTGVCGELHRKMRDKEPLTPARAMVNAPVNTPVANKTSTKGRVPRVY